MAGSTPDMSAPSSSLPAPQVPAASEEEELTVLFALRTSTRPSTNPPAVHICEPLVLTPHDPVGTSLLHTLVAAPLAPPNMVLVRNLLQVSTHLGEVVRAAGGTPVAVPGGTQWHRDVLAG
ncbi:hypothetical protein GGF32_008465, partial [Allomyces javanicus]